MTRARSTTPKRRRQREWMGTVAVIALAAVGGVTAAHFGTHRSWERSPAPASTTVLDPGSPTATSLTP